MNRKGLTLIEMVITCTLLMILVNGLSVLSSYFNKAKIKIDANTVAMYSLESIRNRILVDLRSGKKLSEITMKRYAKILSRFPYPITFYKCNTKNPHTKIIEIRMKSPVLLHDKLDARYIREIVVNE